MSAAGRLFWFEIAPQELVKGPMRALLTIGRQLARPVTAVWAYLGLLGLALRRLLGLFLRLLLLPFRVLAWLYRRLLHRPLRFTLLSLGAFAHWLLLELPLLLIRALYRLLARALRGLWALLRHGPGRARLRLRSGWKLWRARLWLYLHHPAPPEEAILVPRVVSPAQAHLRLNPITAALVTTSLVLLAGYLTTQAREMDEPGVYTTAPSAAIAKVSPAPTLTPTTAPSPTPTADTAATAAAVPDEPGREVEQVPAWPTPDPLSKGGTVAFSMRANGYSDIYLLAVGRAAPIRLTGDLAGDRDPAWSPDGQRLAFSSNRDGNWEIYVLDLRREELTRLTHHPGFDGGPSWSPDGQWLAFESYRDGNLDIYVVSAGGEGQPIRVTDHEAADFSPAWSPGGRHLAFTSRRSGNNDIWALSLDAASDADAVNLTMSPDREEDHPAFSPDEQQVAYYDRSDRFELVYALPVRFGRAVGEAQVVGQGRYPGYSPDGQALVYVLEQGGRSFILAGGIDAWNVATQAFAAQGPIEGLAWSAVTLPPSVLARLDLTGAEEEPLFVENLSPAADSSAGQERYLLWRLDVDAPSPYLSDRVDQSFEALRQRVIEEAGWDLLGRLDGMYASLATPPMPGQARVSWNMAGRAFDLYYRHPLATDPQVEIIREDRGAETYWRVYLRASRQDGSQGEPLRRLPWDFNARYDSDPAYYTTGGYWKASIPSGYYVDFTALAADYGWHPVPAGEKWRTFFQAINYWHFENRQGLALEEAMAEIYTPEELEAAFGSP
jgi:TolB protein